MPWVMVRTVPEQGENANYMLWVMVGTVPEQGKTC
jgi:hypothetical protein